jgi:hypothetical protein
MAKTGPNTLFVSVHKRFHLENGAVFWQFGLAAWWIMSLQYYLAMCLTMFSENMLNSI